MCGILGYYDRTGQHLREDVRAAMAHSICHRGPNDFGAYEQAGVLLANLRLSIIDIAGGHQPFVSDDGQIAVIQNGEIFNHIELAEELAREGHPCRTRSDTEVILRLYERHGLAFMSRLNGMFAIAIYDGRTREMHLIRDRIGVKPLFVHDDGSRVVFGSEIKALLNAGVPRRPSMEALDYFLALNYVPPPLTMFSGVRHVLPGHVETIGPSGTRSRRWWDLADQRAEQQSIAAWGEEFRAVLDDAVRLRLRSDVPFGAFLSGGTDSTAVVAAMSRHLREPVKTFCIGFHDERFDESPFAQIAADRFGTDHRMERVSPDIVELWPLTTYFCDQPHGDVSFLPTYVVSRLAAREVTVILTGDGGDELFAGYDKYREFFANGPVEPRRFRAAYYDKIALLSADAKSRLYHPDLQRAVADADVARLLDASLARAGDMDQINQALFLDMDLLLPGNNLVKPDRMGMAVSLEIRTPFLDYRMMELAFRMPGDVKLRDGITKYVMKEAIADDLGEVLRTRPKRMFTVPIGEWFRSSLSGVSRSLLLDARSLDRQLWRRETVRAMLDDHESGAANYTREIRALIAVEMWYRTFIDELFVHPPTFADLAGPTGAAATVLAG